ncbi:hypothetical protein C9I60_28740, partial [Klebsiella pneumoniae]
TGLAIGWSQRIGYWVHPVLRLLGPVPSTALLHAMRHLPGAENHFSDAAHGLVWPSAGRNGLATGCIRCYVCWGRCRPPRCCMR